ncbi:MAG: hypothetical protein GY926_11795 [bacterium]|nr:hypothetical protein [bacterium]
MTLLMVKPDFPQPDIGRVLDVLAHHRPIEFHCVWSPVRADVFCVDTRQELETRLEELFPFRAYMAPVDDKKRIAVDIALASGPPISGDGENLAAALRNFLQNALDYIAEWERSLRFGADHQKYWGWVYRLHLAGDEDHILATLLGESTN